ncbi:hypothetical protein F5X98DRAFT_375741 [Xylaria grammica]|nr:hypothetical protein F5X98DRAFT_375741 [Xylaria grammica]
MLAAFSPPAFWLEFRLLSDGLETATVENLPLTAWHKTNNPIFGLFSALPTELRLKVWEYLIAPRIVGIACLYLEDGASSAQSQRDEIWGSHPFVGSSVPVLLHVNRETRALALKHYELSFEWKVPRVLAGTDLHPPVSIDRTPRVSLPPIPTSQPASNSASLSHMSSYHDLLGTSPEANIGSRGEPASRTLANGTGSVRRTSSPPRTWFNFDLDAVYLLGELEPCDSFGFNSPMTYFIPSQTARRVRKTAVSFGALRFGETGAQQVFGALFHVVDRFAPVDGEVLVCVTDRDEWTHAMIGNETALIDSRSYSHSSGAHHHDEGNVVQKIWRDWYRGSIVTSPLANLRFSLIREKELEDHVYDFMVATPAKQRKKKKKKGEASTAELGK